MLTATVMIVALGCDQQAPTAPSDPAATAGTPEHPSASSAPLTGTPAGPATTGIQTPPTGEPPPFASPPSDGVGMEYFRVLIENMRAWLNPNRCTGGNRIHLRASSPPMFLYVECDRVRAATERWSRITARALYVNSTWTAVRQGYWWVSSTGDVHARLQEGDNGLNQRCASTWAQTGSGKTWSMTWTGAPMFVCIGEGTGTIRLTFSQGRTGSSPNYSPGGTRLTAEITVQ